MKSTFLYTLRRFRGQMIGWSLGLAIYGLLIVSTYQFVEANAEQLKALINNLPSEFMALAGGSAEDLVTPIGFLKARFFTLMPLIFGIFAVAAGSGLFANDEESGRLDLLMSYPISRTRLFFGRLLAMIAATVVILFVSWGAIAVLLPYSAMDIAPEALLPAFLSLLAVSLVFAVLALLFSMILPSRSIAAMIAGLLLVGSVVLTGLAKINPNLEIVANLLPVAWYQGGEAVRDFNANYVAGLFGAAALLTSVAYWRFVRRDIRVAGEGTLNWRATIAIVGTGVVLLGIVIRLLTLPVSHDSPEEVFHAARTAAEEKKWEELCECLTPEALERWTGELVAYGGLMDKMFDKAPTMKMPPFPRIKLKDTKGVWPFLLEAKMAMTQVDQQALRKYDKTIGQVMYGRKPTSEELSGLARTVKDQAKFTAAMLKAMAHLGTIDVGGRLEHLEHHDDTATATLLRDGEQPVPVSFRHANGYWKVDLPFPKMSAKSHRLLEASSSKLYQN